MGSRSTASSSLVLLCSLFIMFLLFFPRGLIARRLADDISPGEENKQDNGQSKGNVHGSQSRHAGSATGDGSPTGTVQMSPPTSLKKISFARVTVNATNPSPP
ncbi:hypothetical protein K2173_017026 [Erythroxylum novogranatense]|uniref:Uncharacterized protein n=1 Tax=Erythroxylum novogranatense TaxID=1862640 RepID=A0AAV8U5M0_9ROSI|nr:hypothetical protein K2173_017026 [Erythroxylum novogranatense]